MDGLASGEGHKAAADHITIQRIKFEHAGTPARLHGRNQRGARSAKAVKDNVVAVADIPYRIGNHGAVLDGGMHAKRFIAPFGKAVDAGIVPDIRAIAPLFAQAKIIDMGGSPTLEDKDELCLER